MNYYIQCTFFFYIIAYPVRKGNIIRHFSDKLFATKFMYDLFDVLLGSVCSLNMLIHVRLFSVIKASRVYSSSPFYAP